MEDSSLHLLEFDKVRELLKRFAQTAAGRVAIGRLAPLATEEETRTRLEQTGQMMTSSSGRRHAGLRSCQARIAGVAPVLSW